MMMKNKKNVPDIRFKGFLDKWKFSNLENLVELFSGLTYSPTSIRNEGALVLRSSNVKDGKIVHADNVYVASEFVNSDYVVFGDVIVVVRNGSRSLIGKHAMVDRTMNNTVIGAFMTGLRYKQPEFLNALLYTKQFDSQIAKNLGATINQITNGALKSMCFTIPLRIDEQQAIGNYFQNIDRLINTSQTKLDKLKNIKKACLEKMFPRNGSTTPELRFKGFSEEWEEKEMSIVAIFNPKSELPEVFEYVDLESVVGTEMISHREESKLAAPSRAQRLAKQGDLFYQTVRPYQRNNHLFDKDIDNYVFSTGYAQLRPYGNGYFLLSLVQGELFVKTVLDNCTGTSYPAISSTDLAKIKVSIPKYDEQKTIGSLFKNLDILIAKTEQQINKLKNIKKACLDKMFVNTEDKI